MSSADFVIEALTRFKRDCLVIDEGPNYPLFVSCGHYLQIIGKLQDATILPLGTPHHNGGLSHSNTTHLEQARYCIQCLETFERKPALFLGPIDVSPTSIDTITC